LEGNTRNTCIIEIRIVQITRWLEDDGITIVAGTATFSGSITVATIQKFLCTTVHDGGQGYILFVTFEEVKKDYHER